MKYIFLVLLLGATLLTTASSAEYYRFVYKVQENEDYSMILKKFVNSEAIITAQTPFIKKTAKLNPHIKDWVKLEKDTLIDIHIAPDVLDMEKYKNFEAANLKEFRDLEEKNIKAVYPQGWKGSVYYLASLSVYNQKAENVADVNFKQNSPVTGGVNFAYYPKDKLYSFSTNLYFSYLLISTNSISDDKVTVPLEFGLNGYGEYRWEKHNITFFSGLDLDRFSSINFRGLQNDKKIYLDNIMTVYLTFGVAKSFNVFNRTLLTKASLSKSISSSYSNSAPAPMIDASDFVDNGDMSSIRMNFNINYKFNEKFYFHSLIRYHTQTGPSDLSSFRVGAGVGYIFF